MSTETPIISFKELSIKYGDKVILDKLSFDIYPGEIIAIVGPSGSGKTSLANALIDPDFLIEGKPIYWMGEEWDRSDILYKIGFARQFGGLMSDLTVGENLAMPLKYGLGIEESLSLQLAMLNMLNFDLAEEVFYKSPHELSGGMLKKCIMCFATSIQQPVLLLDEPLSGLDPEAAGKMQDIIINLAGKRTVLCITHHRMKGVSRYLFLSPQGHAFGTLEELVSNPLSENFMARFFLEPKQRVAKNSTLSEKNST